MEHRKKSPKPTGRSERHSAAWGKRTSLMLTLLLATGMAFGQRWSNPIAAEAQWAVLVADRSGAL